MAQADQAQKDRLLARQQRKETAARQRQQAQARNGNRSTSTQTPRSAATQPQAKRHVVQTSAGIIHPAYGTLPTSNTTYFYAKSGGKAGEVSLNITGHANGGCWIQLRAYNMGILARDFGPDNVKYESDYIVVGGRFYQPGFLSYSQGTYIDAPTIKIAKDWSHIIYIPLKGQQQLYDRPIAESVYRQHEANINRYNAQHGLFEYDANHQRQEAEYNNRRAQEMRSNSPSSSGQQRKIPASRLERRWTCAWTSPTIPAIPSAPGASSARSGTFPIVISRSSHYRHHRQDATHRQGRQGAQVLKCGGEWGKNQQNGAIIL